MVLKAALVHLEGQCVEGMVRRVSVCVHMCPIASASGCRFACPRCVTDFSSVFSPPVAYVRHAYALPLVSVLVELVRKLAEALILFEAFVCVCEGPAWFCSARVKCWRCSGSLAWCGLK
jgi:hypothetical protein